MDSNPDVIGARFERVDTPLGAALRVALAAVVVAAFFVDLWALGAAPSRGAHLALGGIAICGIAWARWPATTVPIAVVVSFLSIAATLHSSGHSLRFALFTEFVIMPVLFGVLLARPSELRSSLAGVVAIAGELICLRVGQTPIRAIVAISMFVLLGAAGTAVVYIRLRDNERRTSIESARQSERLELARELHDVVGHHVTGIVVLAQASRFTSSSGPDPAAIDDAMAAIEAAGIDTLTSIRRLVGLLRTDAPVTAPPALADVELLIADLRRTHPRTELIIDDRLRAEWVPADLATTVQRLAQEAGTNVRKHGDPSQPAVFSLVSVGSMIHFVAANAALSDRRGEGFGVTGMRERVDALGGTFSAGFESERWVVRAALPMQPASRLASGR